jgi:excisionase family DNA binding protein
MYEGETTRTERPLVVSVGEAARLLGISRAHAYELVARAELAHIRLGRRVVVPTRAIEQLIDNATRP